MTPLLLTLCLLSSGTYKQRESAVHALKVSPASFDQLAGLYRGISPQQWPELSGNLKRVLWQKWQNETFEKYWNLDEYYYKSDLERLMESQRLDFERELK